MQISSASKCYRLFRNAAEFRLTLYQQTRFLPVFYVCTLLSAQITVMFPLSPHTFFKIASLYNQGFPVITKRSWL